MFKTKKSKKDQDYFTLLAKNNKVILTSQMYKQQAGMLKGMNAVKENGHREEGFRLRRSKDEKWYFVLLAPNHKVIGTSEMYESSQGAKNGIDAVVTVILKLRKDDHFKETWNEGVKESGVKLEESGDLKVHDMVEESKLSNKEEFDKAVEQQDYKTQFKRRSAHVMPKVLLEKDWIDEVKKLAPINPEMKGIYDQNITKEESDEFIVNEVEAMRKSGGGESKGSNFEMLGMKYESSEDLAKKLIREPAEAIDANWGPDKGVFKGIEEAQKIIADKIDANWGPDGGKVTEEVLYEDEEVKMSFVTINPEFMMHLITDDYSIEEYKAAKVYTVDDHIEALENIIAFIGDLPEDIATSIANQENPERDLTEEELQGLRDLNIARDKEIANGDDMVTAEDMIKKLGLEDGKEMKPPIDLGYDKKEAFDPFWNDPTWKDKNYRIDYNKPFYYLEKRVSILWGLINFWRAIDYSGDLSVMDMEYKHRKNLENLKY